MGFVAAIKSCFRKYATFSGRAPRSEYWFFFLFNLVVMTAAVFLDVQLGTGIDLDSSGSQTGVITLAWYIIEILPSISVSVRRLHDRNRSGWWYWFVFLPIVGPIVLLIWYCSRGTQGENRFGPDPLAPPAPPSNWPIASV
jgi:uncharacterized membrane protein YhaH (DUF805 family)